MAFSSLYEHACETFQARFKSAFDLCPCCGDSIGPLPSFPTLIADFLSKVSDKAQQIVGFDTLGTGNRLLVPSPEGDFLLIKDGSNQTLLMLLPRRTRFASHNDYDTISSSYDCDHPQVGDVRIVNPAIVIPITGGWKLKERGRLEIVNTLGKTKEPDGWKADALREAGKSFCERKDGYLVVDVSSAQAIEGRPSVNRVATEPIRESAKSFYRRLVDGGSVTNNLVYLDFKKSASKEGLRNIDEFLKEGSSQGAFVVFVSDENHGWVFPNPKLTFNADSLKPLFATLTADQFTNFKEHIEPVPVIRIGKGLWQIEATDVRSHDSRAHSAAYTESKAPEPAKGVLLFPVSAADCLAKTQSSSKVVRHDVVRNLLVTGPNGKGELSLIRNRSSSPKSDSLFVIPRITSFKSADTFHNLYKRYYDCGWPSAGEVWIIKPAVVSKGQGGWHLLEKGRLEIDFVAKKPPVPYPEPEAVENKQTEVGKIEKEIIPEVVSPKKVFEGPSKVSREESSIAQHLIEGRLRLGIGIVASLILLVAIVVAIRRGPSPPVQSHNTPPGPSFSNMVSISGGEFQLGNDAGDAYEKPSHRVSVKPFLMDMYEVTCEEYFKFVKAKNHRTPSNWISGQYPKGAARKPVTGVDWDDANAYARWARKRLPSEAEWEFAARGTTGWRYPWGNDWRADAANAGDSNARQFADVGSYPAGKGPFGTMDMIGNAWEWTSTEWKGYPGGPVPPDASNELRIIRGGYWGSSAAKATTTFRRGWDARGAKTGYENTGFRCAADVNAQTSQK